MTTTEREHVKRALLAERLATARRPPSGPQPWLADAHVPLTPAQRGLWVVDRMGDASAYSTASGCALQAHSAHRPARRGDHRGAGQARRASRVVSGRWTTVTSSWCSRRRRRWRRRRPGRDQPGSGSRRPSSGSPPSCSPRPSTCDAPAVHPVPDGRARHGRSRTARHDAPHRRRWLGRSCSLK